MKHEYLVIDTETGGISPNNSSILQIAGVVWRPGTENSIEPLFNYNINEGNFQVHPKALEINKINIVEHVKTAISPAEAVARIRTKIDEAGMKRKVVMAGHNVNFDYVFTKRLYKLANEKFEQDFDSRYKLDTATLMMWKMACGEIDAKRPSSNELFRITEQVLSEEHRHTALGDALATAHSLQHFWEKRSQ